MLTPTSKIEKAYTNENTFQLIVIAKYEVEPNETCFMAKHGINRTADTRMVFSFF